MAAPPIPPRPAVSSDVYGSQPRQNSLPPPIPPLPPDLRVQDHSAPPHYADPLAAPRPQKLDPRLPVNMARDLDDQANSYVDYARQVDYTPSPQVHPQVSPWQPTCNQSHSPSYSPPTTFPTPASYFSLSPISQSHPRPPHTYQQPCQPQSDVVPAINSLSLNPPPQGPSAVANYALSTATPKGSSVIPALALPTIASLSASLSSITHPSCDPAQKVAWCRDVLFLVNRLQQSDSSTDPPVGPARISDPQLLRLSQIAVPMILQISSLPLPSPIPPHIAEAIFHRGTFAASGAYPDHVRHSPRGAFKDFEAARGGYPAAWFRLGRDYENFNDNTRARNCFERGVRLNVGSCAYRMGMAHLMGQLDLPASPELAIPLLYRAATLATIEVPQPAYAFGLLLLSEFSHVSVAPHFFTPIIPSGSNLPQEARKHLERAAYLNFAPAQYKLGHAYEFAQSPFPFDPLLSVQYYSLASQQGEVEADMALSKWFLCGADGAFEKDESLAWTFAEKAARKGLPSAEFAMGYYAEVGVGSPKDIEAARRWYQRASEHGNKDATDRLSALSQPTPQSLSRKEHDSITETKLVRSRTQAKQRSDFKVANGADPFPGNGALLVDMVPKNSITSSTEPPTSQGRLSVAQEYATTPPTQVHRPIGITPEPKPNTSPRLQPAQPGGKPATQRFALSDSGAAPNPASSPQQPPRVPSPAQQYPGRNNSPRLPVHNRLASGLAPLDEPFTPPAQGKKTGPATFAEMGFQGGKVQDKDCVIM